MPKAIRAEYAHLRKVRERNKIYYRVAHWPIWIFVFFLVPGPLTFRLFAHGPGNLNGLWFALVLLGTGAAGLAGQLPGVEPRPYILRFCEDKPNPPYRRICYTFAWNALLNFALLNLLGLLIAVTTRRWVMSQIYSVGYAILLTAILLLGMLGLLPRAGVSTKGEGVERRYFYSAVWSITAAQVILLIAWKALPKTHTADVLKLILFLATLLVAGSAASLGMLPRTRSILTGELMVAD